MQRPFCSRIKTRRHLFIATFVLLAFGLHFSRPLSAANVLTGISAPDSPREPWQPPDLSEFATELKAKPEAEADAQTKYGLDELIDLAERLNPETQAAWNDAKQAAAAMGLARSEYFPLLAVDATAAYGREAIPVPLTATKAGFLDATAQQAQPALTLEWLLLDFGQRKATLDAAKNLLLAANLGFNARHQQVAFAVQTAFYELSKARGFIDVAKSSLDAATKVQQAAEARYKGGLATLPDVSQARQQAVQATFDLQNAEVTERDAEVTLAEAIGIMPTTPLRVVDFSELSLPTNLEETVDQVIDRSLEQRPDLMAQLAVVRQKEAQVRQADSAYFPKLALV
jgi:outer membrane protein